MSIQTNDPATGERILRVARTSWWALWPRVVFGLLGLALAGWGLLRQDRMGHGAGGGNKSAAGDIDDTADTAAAAGATQ